MRDGTTEMKHYGLNSQAAGLLPLLLPMFLNNFFTYIVSYRIAIAVCFLSIFIFWGLVKGRIYQFMLLPSTLALVLYSIFLIFRLDPVLFIYSPLVSEWLFVAVLAITGMFKRQVFLWLRKSKYTGVKRKHIQSSLNEFFYIAQVTQNLYTLHLFILVFYMLLPDDSKNLLMERLIYTDAPLLIGLLIIIFEQVRLLLIKRHLKSEEWLPVLDQKGKVIGRVPYSVSLNSQIKHCHPIIRIAVIYNCMFYLTKRDVKDPVSPQALDYPLYGHILFKQSVEGAVHKIVGTNMLKGGLKPRSQIRYTFENDKVKNLVSLYTILVRNEEQFAKYVKKADGKLWTRKQIEENLGKGVFSEYFEKEYPYLQNTILLAEEYCGQQQNQKDPDLPPSTDSPTQSPPSP